MQNTFGNFRIKAIATREDGSPSEWWLIRDLSTQRHPPQSITGLHTMLWDDIEANATVFAASETALLWVAFAIKHTDVKSVEIQNHNAC